MIESPDRVQTRDDLLADIRRLQKENAEMRGLLATVHAQVRDWERRWLDRNYEDRRASYASEEAIS